jgi:chloramphenicol 3-O-phosphotransferase
VQTRLGVTAAVVSIDHFFLMHADAKNNWHTFSALSDAVFSSAASLASNGFHVIADTVFERAESLHAAQRALASHPHHFIAVTCDLAVLEARETKRGNRRIGLARDQHTRVFHDASYSLWVDTSRSSVEECGGAAPVVVRTRDENVNAP